MTRVLVVDDEPQILRALRINLHARAYDVVVAANGEQALSAAAASPPDVVVLDLGLPDMDGVDLIRRLRSWTTVPIIILSGRSHSAAKVFALDAGADDYVTKPFNIDELLARLRSAIRRSSGGEESPTVQLGDHVIDLSTRRITRVPAGAGAAAGGHSAEPAGPAHRSGLAQVRATTAPPAADDRRAADLRLTPTEWRLLELLLRNPGKLLTQRDLLVAIRGPNHPGEAHYLRQYMTQLRHKLEPDPARPRHLLTEPGMGYRYQP